MLQKKCSPAAPRLGRSVIPAQAGIQVLHHRGAEGTEKEGTNRQPTTDYRLLPLGFVAPCENPVNAGDGLSDRGS